MRLSFVAALGVALLPVTAQAAQVVKGGTGEITALYLTSSTELSTSDRTATPAELASFLGRPDNAYTGLGSAWVQYDLGRYRLVNRPGGDFNVYELGIPSNLPEYNLVDILVSADGVTFFNLDATAGAALNLAADGTSSDPLDRRSFDVAGAVAQSKQWGFRYIRVDGTSTGSINGSAGFDLDGIGIASFTAVPEPTTWAMMLGGFGFLGAMARRRNRTVVTYA